MRHRKLGYSYTMIVTSSQPSAYEVWRAGRPSVTVRQTRWTPPTDVYETNKSVTVMIELAGIEEDQLEISLYVNALVIEGSRRLPPVEQDGVYRAAQIRQGWFQAAVSLPVPIDSEHIETSYEKGLLRIVLPKANGR